MEDQTPVSPTNWQIIPHIGLDIIWTSMVIPFSEGISLYSTIFQLRHHQFVHFQETSHLLAAGHSLLQHPMRSLVLPPVRSEPPCRRSMFFCWNAMDFHVVNDDKPLNLTIKLTNLCATKFPKFLFNHASFFNLWRHRCINWKHFPFPRLQKID